MALRLNGSGRLDDDAIISGMKKLHGNVRTKRKNNYTLFVRHMAQVGIESLDPRTRGELSTVGCQLKCNSEKSKVSKFVQSILSCFHADNHPEFC